MSSEKLILLAIAIGTIGLVLLLGYKLDKYEENIKRKEKKSKNSSDMINKTKQDIDSNSFKKTYKNGIKQINILEDVNKQSSSKIKCNEELDRTAVIGRVNLSKIDTTEDALKNKNADRVSEFKINIIEEDFKYDNLYKYENIKDSTMVFNTIVVNEEKKDNNYKLEDIK